MKAINRVIQIIDYKGISNSLFEKQNQLSNGYIATQLKRNADLGEGVLNKILNNSLEINPEWLLTGKGEMLREGFVAPSQASKENQKDLEKKNFELKEEISALQKELIKSKTEIIALERKVQTIIAKKESQSRTGLGAQIHQPIKLAGKK